MRAAEGEPLFDQPDELGLYTCAYCGGKITPPPNLATGAIPPTPAPGRPACGPAVEWVCPPTWMGRPIPVGSYLCALLLGYDFGRLAGERELATLATQVETLRRELDYYSAAVKIGQTFARNVDRAFAGPPVEVRPRTVGEFIGILLGFKRRPPPGTN